MMSSAGIALGAILANVTVVWLAGPIGWMAFHFVCLSILMVALVLRDRHPA